MLRDTYPASQDPRTDFEQYIKDYLAHKLRVLIVASGHKDYFNDDALMVIKILTDIGYNVDITRHNNDSSNIVVEVTITKSEPVLVYTTRGTI